MEPSVWPRLAGAVVTALALVACGSSTSPEQSANQPGRQDVEDTPAAPPNEGVILAGELLHVVERAGLYSLPTDPVAALAALLTFPDQLGNVIAMHLGRLYPTPNEFIPGFGPLVDLLQARAELLLSGGQATRILQDTADFEFSILLLPVEATTAIVILPTRVVRARADAAALPEAKVDLSQVTYEVNGRTRTVEQFMQSGSTNAIAFMHKGRFIYDDYQNGFNTKTRHHMWSVTKSVTTSLVGIAVAEGLVHSIHDPITKYIAEAAGTVWEGVSIEDLLQMESGTYWVDVPIHQPEELVLMGADYHSNGLAGMTRDEYLLRLTRVSNPGEFYRYNSGDAQMLAWLLERVYHKPYAELLSEKIWQPAGMQDDALVMVDRLGNTFASMGLHATPRDMLRFGELHRNGGRSVDGRQIIPAAWVRASHHYDKATGGGPRGYMWPHWGGVESGNYTAEGYGHQLVSVAPSLHMVGVRFGNDPIDTIVQKEWEAVLTAVGNYLD
ncbi:serine hydrolase domain-containing protein [Solimonas sp. K1W22B-7]|uniref:serine hydrolase domain-containing protein n=1 Tax=Solimonas sp. K1W22B-7 TaxID=2303331 RepID=UPI0013C518D9|nr:serine hydrolase [Solimonas sp. K1W22B-7]